ncbi:hypothetical protein ACHAWF_017174 [Thalassiosira exigua]
MPLSNEKASELRLFSTKRPHMRAFYVSLVSMFCGMFLWFAPSPLQSTIEDSVENVTNHGLAAAATCSVLGSMISRLVVGVACDAYGARLSMVAVLVIISVATGMTTLVTNNVSLSVCRFFSGFGGSTLVAAQFWVSCMFEREIIGTATSIVLGVGYAGGGFALAFLGGIASYLDWRKVLIIPTVAGFGAAAIALCLADDTPNGKYTKVELENDETEKKITLCNRIHFSKALVTAASKFDTWILAFQYGCSAGTNTALLNIAPIYFEDVLGASSTASSAITSSAGWFGLICFVGGLCSDKAMSKSGIRGRCLIQALILCAEGVCLLAFSFVYTIEGAAALFVLCSLMATWAVGSTYALVPYVAPTAIGSVAGIVGFVGSLGAVVLIQLANAFLSSGRPQYAYIIMSALILVSSAMSFLLGSATPKSGSSGDRLECAAGQDIENERQAKETGLATASVSNGTVPVIDLMSAASDDEIAEMIFTAATEVGFFIVVGTGISQDIVDAAFRESKHFFDLPLSAKEEQSPFERSLNSGYEYKKQVRPATGLADQKESFHITARRGCMDGRWPKDDEFRKHTELFIEAANGLAHRILDYLEQKTLPNATPGTLSKSHTLWGDQGQCCLRLIHYPKVPKEDIMALRQAGYWRCGTHTDWANLGLLFQHAGQDGLECCSNPRDNQVKEKTWMAVSPPEGGVVVNIGDMLSRWTDGRLLSNLHRVRLPLDDEMMNPRYSIGYFAQSDRDALIESSDADPITAGDYILGRVKANFKA